MNRLAQLHNYTCSHHSTPCKITADIAARTANRISNVLTTEICLQPGERAAPSAEQNCTPGRRGGHLPHGPAPQLAGCATPSSPPNTVQPSTGRVCRGMLYSYALYHQLWLYAVCKPQHTVCCEKLCVVLPVA